MHVRDVERRGCESDIFYYYPVAICAGDCGRGKCKRPNQCLCPDKRLAPSCVAPIISRQPAVQLPPDRTQILGDHDYGWFSL